MSLKRDPDRIRAWRERGAKKYADRVRDEVLSGEREWESLERGGPIKPVNRERRKKRFKEGFESEERVAWYRHQFCVVPGCEEGPCEVAHVRSRGAGGTADDAVPMCHSHHSESHQIGILTFQKKHGLDLEAEAHRYARAWQRWEAREE